ncbi:response regulator [Flavobacterium sp. T12S277]|uniref:response regulator n=1 Tax=Flavobacterium sp. T12S277 TaxID=3402752 RepID=UPI003AE6F124
MTYNILIVDDHPLVIDTYKNLLSKVNIQGKKINIITSHNCENAYKKIIIHIRQNISIDLALLDINLPPYKEGNINNGIDLSLLLRKKIENCKIFFITKQDQPLHIDKIIREVNPEGFASQKDINFKKLLIICERIIIGEKFRSLTIVEIQKELLKKKFNWDKYDNRIITLIYEGVKTMNLPNHIPLSMSAIEKRKAHIKSQLLLEKGNDRDLISKAKKLGLL